MNHMDNIIRAKHFRCNSCGGNMIISAENERPILSCPYCGSKELLDESENIILEKIKSDAEKYRQQIYREVELAKINKLPNAVERINEVQRENWKMMKPITIGVYMFLALICLIVLIWSAGRVHVPENSDDLVGKNYEIVSMKFQDAGFKNIELVELEDVLPEDMEKGGIKEITLDGTSFSTQTTYNKKSIIRIYYYKIDGSQKGD